MKRIMFAIIAVFFLSLPALFAECPADNDGSGVEGPQSGPGDSEDAAAEKTDDPAQAEDASDLKDTLRKVLEEIERLGNLSEILSGVQGIEAGMVKSILERRDFHYDLKLGNVEYQVDAMSRFDIEALGLRVQNVSPALEAQLGLGGGGGILIVDVKDGGPAAKAGFEKYDVLISIGESVLASVDNAEKEMGALPREKELTCRIVRKGEAQEIKMTLDAAVTNGDEKENGTDKEDGEAQGDKENE